MSDLLKRNRYEAKIHIATKEDFKENLDDNKLPPGVLSTSVQENKSPVFRLADEKLKRTIRVSLTTETYEKLARIGMRNPGLDLSLSDVARQAIEFALMYMEEK